MRNKTVLLGIILVLLLLAGCDTSADNHAANNIDQAKYMPAVSTQQKLEPAAGGDGPELSVHFIDLGQADAILVKTPAGENILIDGGGNDDEKAICDYLKSQQLNKIQVLVGTHPHEDHIGGLDAVINSFPVENVYMPQVTHNTETFKDLLQAIKARGLKIRTAQAGVNIPLEGLNCTILSPIAKQYENLNDYSAVLKLSFGKQSFLFCGDAGSEAESDMLAAGYNLQAAVIKIAHHGSASSSSASFLQAVFPSYAVISCGQDNPYGHPHEATLDRLKAAGIRVLRTDQLGTIIITTDGKDKLDISVNSKECGDQK